MTCAQLCDFVSVKQAFRMGSLDKNSIVDSSSSNLTFIIPKTSCPTCLMIKAFKIKVMHLNSIYNNHKLIYNFKLLLGLFTWNIMLKDASCTLLFKILRAIVFYYRIYYYCLLLSCHQLSEDEVFEVRNYIMPHVWRLPIFWNNSI